MKKKGFSLVEVVVSIFVFVVTLGGILICYLVTTNGYQKEREYLYFEGICHDIDAHYDTLGLKWNETYFNYNKTSDTHYYNYDYVEVDDVNAKYKLVYKYINNELFITILNQEKNYNVISDLNYGVPKNEKK